MTRPAESSRSISVAYLLLFFSLFVFIIFSLPRIQDPISQDELWWFVAAKTLISSGVPQQYCDPAEIAAFSPHLYLYSLASAFRLFGQSEAIARLPGILWGCLSIVLIFFVIRSFTDNDRKESPAWAAVICLFYATSPVMVQGASLIDIDMTLLVPAVVLVFWFYSSYQKTKDAKWAVLTGLAVSLAFWAKITTPIVLIIFLIPYTLWSQKNQQGRAIMLGALVSGILIFLGTWYLYCRIAAVPFSAPFAYAWEASFGKTITSGSAPWGQLLQNAFLLTLWTGVMPLLLLLGLAADRIRSFLKDGSHRPEDVFLWGGLIIVAGYMVVGGASFGYPKYQVPGLALALIYLGIRAAQHETEFFNRGYKTILLIALIVSVLHIFFVGDPVYQIRYALREAIAYRLPEKTGIIEAVLLNAGLSLIVYAAVLFFWRKRGSSKSFIGIMLTIAIGSNAGTLFVQSRAGYMTGYNYGGSGLVQAVETIRRNVPPGSVVIAPGEIIYYLNSPSSRYVPNALWTDTVRLRGRLEEPATAGFVYNAATNTVQQIQSITSSPLLQNTLHREYRLTEIGNYKVWMRRSLWSQDHEK